MLHRAAEEPSGYRPWLDIAFKRETFLTFAIFLIPVRTFLSFFFFFVRRFYEILKKRLGAEPENENRNFLNNDVTSVILLAITILLIPRYCCNRGEERRFLEI